ncbi:S-adenosyl-L-methionine-dependent methyltransferase [Thamnocephalis sphaerospora]|uniref:S-adenosyl-L-methionine-dependent methyltransferase n=1 Tax=Thamnocephalis sphaerospora TaxID=78915 RepID=A0A4P9XHZ8_9FUNG|nr:S-adenosyl-L-methionine-dependent methyltransferase [Thamnocephalis sphaerospora]|eukprot:RKP05322.1 S-adenosyl-L-methionine-dependent methyltransferase [Thamnocephalis sphaerospora]
MYQRYFRLDLQHYAVQQVTQKRYHAPLSNPRRVLDIGTGSGVWMLEMAAEFPSCEFTGIDIAPLQPATVLPQNCKFEIANVLEGLSYADGYFDCVRHSLLVAAIPKEKWLPYVKECARVCASGGWVEMIEADCRGQGGGPVSEKLADMIVRALQTRGLSPDTGSKVDRLMCEAGLVDVKATHVKIPVGSWGGTAGELFAKNARMANAILIPLLANTLGISREEMEQLAQQGEEEIERYHMSMNLYVYVGRKP